MFKSLQGKVYFKKNLELHIQGCYEGKVCLTGGGRMIFYLHIGDRIMVWLGGRIGKKGRQTRFGAEAMGCSPKQFEL